MPRTAKKIGTLARLKTQQEEAKRLAESYKTTLFNILSEKESELKPYDSSKQEEVSIPIELAKREALKNTALAQDIALKKQTLDRLFYFLGGETVVIFLFTLFQATHWLNFGLEEWTFKLLITATILQITYMLRVAVKHLFPTKKDQ